ncbi:MMPL family transporter [Erythrobacter sp.]|uniref:efflux RND transporter permease subunit n=1 Tax=Erythrobacter sp. TaxID=1042 RepID=UPI001425EDF2|nr:MMPL family transporter [Erythrobacter sp.]QIQ86356.1 MAG: MMPL family transporter [Erythrobacter sp.]
MPEQDRPDEARLDARRSAIMDAGFPEIEWPTLSGMIVDLPWVTTLIGLLPVALFAAGLAWLERDPSVDAFVSHDHPAWQARELARETFGLEDPAIVVFAEEPGTSAFNAPTLSAVDRFTDEVAALEGVEPGVISIGSEKAILATAAGDLEAPEIIDPYAIDPQASLELYRQMPALAQTLVSENEDALMVIVPVTDPNRAEEVTAAMRDLAQELAPPGVSVYQSGVATMNARLAEHIAGDTRVFLPAAFVVIGLFLLLALRRARAIIGPIVVVIGSALSAVGAIGLFGSKYYLITTALPVVVMAIAVADSIHLTLAYQRARAQAPQGTRAQAMKAAIDKVALPIVLTSVTTALGFAGLAIGSPMKPIADFGLVGAVGVMVACVLSLTVLPLIQMRLADLPPAVVRARRLDDLLSRIAQWSALRPAPALALSAVVVGGAIIAASQVEFDYERRNYFTPGDDVLVADDLIAERFSGGNILDVVIDSGEDEALLTAGAVRDIVGLQQRLEAMPAIGKVTSYGDAIGLMHERLNAAPPGALPDRRDAPAQYMFLYEASGDPGDFDAQLDFTRRFAMVRGYLENGEYSSTKPVIREVGAIVEDWSRESGLDASLSGRMAVNDGWMDSLKASHPFTIGAAVLMVWAATFVLLRGFGPAMVAMLPVLSGIALLYAAMGLAGIDLAPATSMCAAIAAGLGVDFGIHLVQELRSRIARGDDLIAALSGNYVTVMRACFFSAVSLGAGFTVVALSETPVLRWFGVLIAFAAMGSLFGALVLVPAIASITSKKWSSTNA